MPRQLRMSHERVEADVDSAKKFKRMMRRLICPTGLIRGLRLGDEQERIAGQDCVAVVYIGGVEKIIPIRLHADPRLAYGHNRARAFGEAVSIYFQHGLKEEPQTQRAVAVLRDSFNTF